MQKKINPKRRNESYLLYSEEEGGDFKVFGNWDKKSFKELEKRGWFEYRIGDGITKVYPAFATLVKGVDNHDFRIDEINGTRKSPKTRVIRISRNKLREKKGGKI